MNKSIIKSEYANTLRESALYLFIFILFCFIFPLRSSAQMDTVYVPDTYETGGREGTLNDSVQAAINAGTLSGKVFILKPYGLYVLSGTIKTPPGQTLEIMAAVPGNTQETAPPMIAWTASSTPSKRHNFDIAGKIRMKNVWLLYASPDGRRSQTSLRVGDSTSVDGGCCEFENVIFDYSPVPQNASGAVEIYATHFKGSFKNCYFRNCADDHFRYYGRALSYRFDSRNLHADSVLFENCTFANIGYVLMQEGGEYCDNVHFNHCTFLNVVMFSLESGWWYKLSVTNSLFVNTYFYGDIPVNSGYNGGQPDGGTVRIDSIAAFGFEVPFTEQERRILFTNSSYYIEKWLEDYMWNNSGSEYRRIEERFDEIPVPQPMMNERTIDFFESDSFPYMNKANLYDGSNPGFLEAPTAIDSIKEFLWCKWWSGCDHPWAWKPDNSLNQVWPLEENLVYTNDTLLTAGMNSFPVGDLYRWFPDKYQQWDTQKEGEKERISQWLETGKDPGIINRREPPVNHPVNFELHQNYPNPFNPLTRIEYVIPYESYISLKVYNLIGQEVERLFEGRQKAGRHMVLFDGSALSSGIYFYKLQANDIIQIRKFTLIK